MKCSHANGAFCGKEGIPNFGLPIVTSCRRCEHYAGPSRGLGDVIHRVTEATGIAHVTRVVTGGKCNCQARREALNEKFPVSANESIDGEPK